ncbi:MAG: translocation/assembly module TamB domain-containing protein [Rhodospirillaceae bacterium]|nr:translocation/assembly module TamB domain-containing protein [Rhodospirillaceae bacterium]
MRPLRILRFAALTIGVLLALVAGAAIALDTAWGKRMLLAQLGSWLAQDKIALETEGVAGSIWDRFTIDSIVLSDESGIFATIDDLVFDWQPSRLFAGELAIETLAADRVAVDRLPPVPTASEPEPDSGPLLPEPPLDIRIDAFEIGMLQIGSALAGEAAELTVSGNGAVSSLAQLRIHLDARRLDGVAAEARLDVEFDAAENHLLLDGRLVEPEGGVIAHALGLEAAPALTATLDGTGPLQDWTGKFALDGGPDLSAALDVTIAGEEPYRIALSGDAMLVALLPGEWRFLAAPDTKLDAAFALGEDGTLVIERLNADNAALNTTLSGSVTEENELALTLTLETRDIAGWQTLVPPVSFEKARIEAQITGTIEAPEIETVIRIDEPSLDDSRATALGLHGSIDVEGELVRFDLSGRLFDFTPSDTAIATSASGEPILRAVGSWNRVDGTVRLDNAVLDVGTVRILADGTIDPETFVGDFAVNGSIRNLAVLAPLTGLDFGGRATFEGHVAAGATGLSGIVTMDATGLTFGDATLDGLLGGDAALAATLSMPPDGPFEIADLSLEASGLTLDGNASIDLKAATIDGDYRLRLPQLARVDPSLAGSLDGEGRISGALDDPSVTMVGTVASLAIDGQALGRYRIDASIENPTTALKAKLTASGQSPAGPLNLRVTATPTDRGIELSPLHLAIGDHSRLDGRVLLRADTGIAEGGLDLRIDTLAPYGTLLDTTLGGALEATVELSAVASEQQIALNGDLVAPSFGDIVADRASLDATATMGKGAPALTASLEASAITAGSAELDTLALSLDGTTDRLAGSLATQGEFSGTVDLTADFDLAIADDTTQLTVTRLDGIFAGEPAALEQPLLLTIAPDTLSFDNLALTLGPAQIAGRMQQGTDTVAAALTVADLPVGWIGEFGDLGDAVGTIDATLSLAGTPQAPTAQFDATIEGLAARTPRFRDETTMTAVVTARYANGRFDLTSDWRGLGDEPLAIEASLPLQFALEPFVAELAPTGPISGFARWKGDARYLLAVVPIDPHRLEGLMTLDLTLGGTMQAPQVNGSMTLTDGQYENFVSGTLLKDLDIVLTASGQNDLRFALTGTDGNKGTISADGTIAVDPARAVPFDVTATFNNAVLVRRDEVKARASGNVHLVGTTAGATLTGDVVVNRLDGRLDAGLPPQVTKLDVIEINGPEGVVEQPEEEPIAPFALELDVAVSIPTQAYLRGRGLDSEWHGDLKITGNANAPRIVGRLQPRRGTFSFADRMFDIADSVITFDGSTEIDPVLDVSATSNVGSLTAIIRVTGRSSDPVIAITSRPPLPQDEVLARLLFGRKGGELSPVQALQLAQVLASLSGRGPSTGILDVARQTLGVDVLTVSGGDDDGAGPGVEIGQYLTQDVRVGVEQGFGTGSTAGTVEIELTDELSVESRVQQDGSRVGITWGHDY